MIAAKYWLREEIESAPANFAKLLTSDGAPIGPVDVEAALASRASVEFLDWTADCDAVVDGLLENALPRVFIRRSPAYSARRSRFTMAHELGHIVIPWHIQSPGCNIWNSEELDLSGDQEELSAGGEEREANTFAACFLLPYQVLKDAASGAPLEQFFRDLDQFEMSPYATVLRVMSCLYSGFIFEAEFSSDCNRLSSPGTNLNRLQGNYRDLAFESGCFEIAKKKVRWYRLAPQRPSVFPRESIKASQALSRAIMNTGIGSYPRINGVVGGALSSATRFGNVEEAFGHLLQWTYFHETIPTRLRDHPDFSLYLYKQAESRVQSLT